MLVDRVQSFPAVTMKDGFELRVFEGTDYFVEVPDVSVADAAGSLRFVGVLHGFPASSAEHVAACGDYRRLDERRAYRAEEILDERRVREQPVGREASAPPHPPLLASARSFD